MRLTISGDKSLTFLPVIRWQLNCHPFWYIRNKKQYEIKKKSSYFLRQ